MDPSSYKYNAMAFWFDRIDDEVLPEYDIEQMADALDATAQDVVSFYLDRGEVPYLCSEQDQRLLENAPEMLKQLRAVRDDIGALACDTNGWRAWDATAVDELLGSRLVRLDDLISTAEGRE
jgi:hypothetical protein